MDESFCISDDKFPEGQPSDEWTVEELLHWSLSQYHTKVTEQTAQSIESLRNQCKRECDDVLTLHKMAADMAASNTGNDNDNTGIKGSGSVNEGDEENVNPQSSTTATNADPAGGDNKTIAKSASTVSAASSAASTVVSSTTKTTIEAQMIVGPHLGSNYILRPKPGAPCWIGRSKGKKFIKNGVSLTKDQEVSTTHGKFVVETVGTLGSGGGMSNKFYFIDVGSTNGSVFEGEQLEPNERLALFDGMELKIGNSVMKIILG